MDIPFRTVKAPAKEELIVLKSRFIGCAYPASDEETALDLIRQTKEEHPSASHHCFAYVIGPNAGIMRYQDDGEPSGTAGLPIMEVLRQRQLTNVCVVVVRYFGGTLLGKGGLVRAYSKACVLAVDSAQVVSEEPSIRMLAEIAYTHWDRVQFMLKSQPILIEDTSYAEHVTLQFIVRVPNAASVSEALMQATDGKSESIETDRLFYQWPETQDI